MKRFLRVFVPALALAVCWPVFSVLAVLAQSENSDEMSRIFTEDQKDRDNFQNFTQTVATDVLLR